MQELRASRRLWRLRFPLPADRAAVEADLGQALFAVECLYGLPRLRLEVAYTLSADGGTCVVESRGEAGEAVARLLLGLASARVGDALQVELVAADARSRTVR